MPAGRVSAGSSVVQPAIRSGATVANVAAARTRSAVRLRISDSCRENVISQFGRSFEALKIRLALDLTLFSQGDESTMIEAARLSAQFLSEFPARQKSSGEPACGRLWTRRPGPGETFS